MSTLPLCDECDEPCASCVDLSNTVAASAIAYQQDRQGLAYALSAAFRHGLDPRDLATTSGLPLRSVLELLREVDL